MSMILLEVELPIPPSLNNSYMPSRRGGRFPTKRLRDWQRAAQEAILSSRCSAAVEGWRVSIELELITGKGWMITRDPDNIIKHTIDSIVDSGVLEGDTAEHVARVSITTSHPAHKQTPARLTVRVSLADQNRRSSLKG